MKYRVDVQILRGIAVSLVVLFHLNIGGFSSGFLGVDVFFVISGYLMGEIYDPKNIKDFYAKRIKRLLPTYWAVVWISLVVAFFLCEVSDFRQVAEQSLFATLFLSNIGYWLETSYFDKSSFRPLLHLWSLGVEIQFYLLVPLVFLLIKNSWKRLIILGGVSFLLCLMFILKIPKWSFFLMPLRMWEFLLGFAVASYAGRIPTFHKSEWLGTAALFIIFSIPFIPLSPEKLDLIYGHPSLIALLISLATASVLIFGVLRQFESSYLGFLLERLGGYSYSIYLSHFPFIVFVNYQPFSGTLIKPESFSMSLFLLFGISVVSLLLFFFVEKPFRKVDVFSPFRSLLVFISSSVVLIFTLQWLVEKINSDYRVNISNAWVDRAPYRCGKLFQILHPGEVSCELTGTSLALGSIFLVGNSHADSIKAEFSSVAKKHGYQIYLTVSNSPLMPGGVESDIIFNEALRHKVSLVVLHFSPSAIRPDIYLQLADRLAAVGIRVAFLMPVPMWPESVPQIILQAKYMGKSAPVFGLSEYNALHQEIMVKLSSSVNIKIYPIAQKFCTPKCINHLPDGRPFYFDTGHLTLTGAHVLAPVFEEIVQAIQVK